MHLPSPRGPLSDHVVSLVRTAVDASVLPDPGAGPHVGTDPNLVWGEDFQLALWVAYECHFGGFEDAAPDAEWNPHLIAFRARLEEAYESCLRRETAAMVPEADPARVEEQVARLVRDAPDSGLTSHLRRQASREEFLDFLRLRSIYHLKESDPQSFLLARLRGPAKVALAELQYDEYGAGRPAMLHQELYAEGMRGVGLADGYGHYIDSVDAATLAVNNVGSFFNLHRRLRGAAAGHLAAFEATSSGPCRRIAQGIRRLELSESMHRYFDEHVEADAVHEHMALGDICVPLVEAEPHLAADVLFGAAVCLHVDDLAGRALLRRWGRADDSGRRDAAEAVAS